MSEKKVVITDLVKAYGHNEVLHKVNLELEKGKIYGFIGRNGAGKTTLLSIASGQNPATSGTITVDGMPVWENQEARDLICFSRELSPMTGNGANNTKVKDYIKAASIYIPTFDKEYADELVKAFGLDTKKRISKLSKGMMSMVTIIVALASKAEYTFLDEPVAGLDIVAREKFYKILLDEFAESQRTFVISTHIIEEAADVFEEVIIIDQGNILLKKNTNDLVESVVHISGKDEDIETLTQGRTVYNTEKIGRSKGATVALKDGETDFDVQGLDVSVQPMNLQQIFVAMCGKEAEI